MSHRLLAPLVVLLVTAGCAHHPASLAGSAATGPEPVTSARDVARQPGDMGTPPTELASELELSPVFFEYDSARLTAEATRALDAHVRSLRAHPGSRLLIEGHCDERGTAEYNLGLGERRAEAVRVYLRDAGVDASRLRILSYGKERPFALGHDEGSWRQNRRAHLSADR